MGSQTLRAAAAWIELGKLPEVSRSTTAGVKRHVHGPEPPQPPQPESGSWQEVRLVHTNHSGANPNSAVGMLLVSSPIFTDAQNLLNKSVVCW